jgi:phosphate transport system protein
MLFKTGNRRSKMCRLLHVLPDWLGKAGIARLSLQNLQGVYALVIHHSSVCATICEAEQSMATSAKSQESGKKQELIRLSLQACLIAKDAVKNLADALSNSSSMAFLAVNDCEKELDEIDQYIDEHIAEAILNASAREVRELLACLKFTIDLERIGDLIHDIVVRLRSRSDRVAAPDLKELVQMTVVLEQMLEGIYAAYCARDVESALSILKMDGEIDRLRSSVFLRHVGSGEEGTTASIDVLMMTQSLERAGDHAKNLAEEVCHLVEGHSLRHLLDRDKENDESSLTLALKGRSPRAKAFRRS